MSDLETIIGIIYILALTTPIVPLAVGLEAKGESNLFRQVLVALIFAATQALMAFLGYLMSGVMGYYFGDLLRYMVFGMMLIVAAKMVFDSMKVLKAKRLYSFTSNWGFLLLGVLSAMNALLMGVCGQGFMPFGNWLFLALAFVAFFWAFCFIRIKYEPKMLKRSSFIEFSGAVAMVVVAILFLFTDLI